MYELWFRAVYQKDLARRKIHAAVRPGDRRFPLPKGMRIGEVARIRIIVKPGSEEHGIAPAFNGFETRVRITDLVVKTIGELSRDDLRHCSEDARTGESVKKHLQEIYGRHFDDKEPVTVVHWEYLTGVSMNDLTRLITRWIATIGVKAKDNPDSLDFDQLAVGIANKDYPAQTPFLWNRVYRSLGANTRNVRIFADPVHAPAIFTAFRNDPRYIGGDVGVGYKDRVLGLLDDIDPLAKVMGAVNVVVKTENGLTGYNTDGDGFAESLESVFRKRSEPLRDKTIVLLGAGGTANAIAFALANRGASIVILNRTVSKAEDLAGRVNQYFQRQAASFAGRDALAEKVAHAHAIVSIIDDPHSDLDKFSALAPIDLPATGESIGRNIAEAARLLDRLPRTVVIADVMLRDHDTATIAQAKKMGFETLDGLPMVQNQAVEAFYLVNQKLLSSKGMDRRMVADIMQGA
jgi:shikimate dehydrogenase